MIFVETSAFKRKVRKIWTATAYRELKDDLTDNPDLGDLIRGGRGIRKIRRRVAGRGKSGGVRVIYFWAVEDDTILMLDIYAKKDKGNLSDRELADLVKVMSSTAQEIKSRRRRPNPEFVRAACLIENDRAFVFGKTYRVRVLPSGRIAVKDENGETVICNRRDFDIE